MKRLIYVGFNEMAILNLIEHKQYNLLGVITQEDRLSLSTIKLLSVLNISVHIVSNKKDINQHLEIYEDIDYILINYFGIIIPDEVINKYKCFNIHTGDLKTNRGPYPCVWTILLNYEIATSTLYKLGKKVDTGEIISKYNIEVGKTDDNITVARKLDKGIKYHLDQLLLYQENINYEIVVNGIYRKKAKFEDITINKDDSLEDIKRKINSQKSYGGALLKYSGLTFKVSEVFE